MPSDNMKLILVRVPDDVHKWIDAQKAVNCTSKSAEIVRALRERMERDEGKLVGSND